jgi:cytochrome c553
MEFHMARMLKWLAWLAAAILVLAIAAVLFIVGASEHRVARTYDVPLSDFDAPSDRASARRGRHLATIYGCTNCHGADLRGTVFIDDPGIGRVHAPNLTSVVKEYTDAELERLIRRGVKRNGTSVWIMPAEMYNHLTDGDLADLIAFVRSAPQRDGYDRKLSLGPLARLAIALGKFGPAAEQAKPLTSRVAPDRGDPLSLGRYLVMTACTECHGATLQGSDLTRAPNLVVAAAYSDDEFARLMHEGIGVGGRELGLMAKVAKARFSSFSVEELHAIRRYLSAYVQAGGVTPP